MNEEEIREVKQKMYKLLDRFAGMAMQGIVSDANNNIAPDWDTVATHSYACAEAMLKKRKEVIDKLEQE